VSGENEGYIKKRRRKAPGLSSSKLFHAYKHFLHDGICVFRMGKDCCVFLPPMNEEKLFLDLLGP
jgi:hypothetical protein